MFCFGSLDIALKFVDYLLAVIFLCLSAEKDTQFHSRNLEGRRIYHAAFCVRPYEKMACDLHLVDIDMAHILGKLKFPKIMIYIYIQGGSNMTGTDLYVNKPHCAAAVRS